MADDDKLSVVLADLARTLLTDIPIQTILDELVLRIVDLLPVTSAGVTLIGPDHEPRDIAASSPAALRYEGLQTELGDGPCVIAHRTRRPVSVPDLGVETRFPHFAAHARRDGLAAVFAFPLHHGPECLGALDLYRDRPGPLGTHDMDVAQTLADVAAAYLLNARARVTAEQAAAQLQHRSVHDPLTKLPNRALLQERIAAADRRAERSDSVAAVLFVDLDRFKLVNDTYGHRAGDELLLAVADRLSALLPDGDTLARMSGDEFVFLHESVTGPADLDVLVDRVRRAFDAPFRLPRTGVLLGMSASVGAAFAGPGTKISEDLVAEADLDMYMAKREERDRFPRRAALTVPPVMEAQLRLALDRGDLDVAHASVVRDAGGKSVGVEALVCWPIRHADGGDAEDGGDHLAAPADEGSP